MQLVYASAKAYRVALAIGEYLFVDNGLGNCGVPIGQQAS